MSVFPASSIYLFQIIHQALQELEVRQLEDNCEPQDTKTLPEKESELESSVPEKPSSIESDNIVPLDTCTIGVDSLEPESTAAEPSKAQSKKCQASVSVPQRTRRIQVSMKKDTSKKSMVSTGTQCTSLNDGISLRVAAGLQTPDVSQQCAWEDELSDHSEVESSDDEDNYEDPDYDPLNGGEDPESDESSDESEEGFRLRTDVRPEEERQFLVSESQLALLLQNCVLCGGVCETVVKGTRGTMISTSSVCVDGHSTTWDSQRCHQGMPWANLLVAGAIIFSGANASKSLRLFRHLNLQMISTSTFSRMQASYVVPASVFTWDFHQQTLLDEYQGQRLTLGGDARCDSPGFSAKFGSYTLMDLSTGKILDFQLVQVFKNCLFLKF
jgi:hypothetical protein